MTSHDLPEPHDPLDPELGELLGLLARLDAAAPPASVRDRVLAGAADSPREATPSMPALDVFEHCVTTLDELLAGLGDGDHLRDVSAYDWTVHELVAHLAAVERHTRSVLGLAPDDRDPDRLDHLSVGREFRAGLLTRPPRDAVDAWRDAAYDTIAHLRAGVGPGPQAVVQLHQWPFALDSLLIVRSFEVWTHTDDVRRATGRPLDAPPPAALRAMSSLSVQSLPLLSAVVTSRAEVPGVRVVLTGEGGGTHDIGTGARTATMVADVVDYCRLVARRADASVFDVEGDPALAADLVAAAQAIAM